MPFFAFPPNLIMSINRQLLWTYFLVPTIIPFLNQIRSDCQKIIVTSYSIPAAAIWTSVPKCTVMDGGEPAMAFIASPPDFFLAAPCKMFWQFPIISFIIPFYGKSRICCGKIVIAGQHPLAAAIWAIPMTTIAAVDSRFPAMSCVTSPPDFLIASLCKVLW